MFLPTKFHKRDDTLETSMEMLVDSLPSDARRTAVPGS